MPCRRRGGMHRRSRFWWGLAPYVRPCAGCWSLPSPTALWALSNVGGASCPPRQPASTPASAAARASAASGLPTPISTARYLMTGGLTPCGRADQRTKAASLRVHTSAHNRGDVRRRPHQRRQQPVPSRLGDQGVVQHQMVDAGGQETLDGIIWCLDNRLSLDVERGVEQHRYAGQCLEFPQQPVEARVLSFSHRLYTCRAIHVHNGGDLVDPV